jgi:hypothetical protein
VFALIAGTKINSGDVYWKEKPSGSQFHLVAVCQKNTQLGKYIPTRLQRTLHFLQEMFHEVYLNNGRKMMAYSNKIPAFQFKPITASRPGTLTVFVGSNTGIVGSNSTRGIGVCVGSGLATGLVCEESYRLSTRPTVPAQWRWETDYTA